MLLITTPNIQEEVLSLKQTAQALDWNTFSGWRVPEHLIGQKGAVYGELFFCEVVAEQMGWTLVQNSLDWLTKLPEEYVCRDIKYMSFKEAYSSVKEEKFIKPADDKCFPAKVYSSGQELPYNSVLDDAPVLVSDVMQFSSEYRCFVLDRKVVAACCYYLKSKKDIIHINDKNYYNHNFDNVVSFVSKMLQDPKVECAKSCVIDVGKYRKDSYAIIESNPVYASGLYGCELTAALHSIRYGIKEESNG